MNIIENKNKIINRYIKYDKYWAIMLWSYYLKKTISFTIKIFYL